MNLNKVFVLGRLTTGPQAKQTQSGQSVTTFSIATNRTWSDKNGKRNQETEYHNIVLWGRLAELAAQFLVKGSEMLIEGRLTTREWQDKQGNTRKTTEIIGEEVQLGAKPQTQRPEAPIPIINPDEDTEDDIDPNSLPF